ncbi:MAG TPA: penicillin-binding protein 2 [Solirubrobacteraceae bacterium]|nr:penicillin-binding protein 2 [Solirubrobacteraceae bacterium]
MAHVERRIGFLFSVFLALLILAGGRAGWLGLVEAKTLKRAAATQQESDIVVPARRGTITDRNGVELAVSQPATTIAATPYLVEDPARAAKRLGKALGRHEDELLRQLARRDTGFVYLARHVRPSRARRVEKLGIAGLEYIPEFRRDYPRTWMASQLLGNVGVEGHGLSGLEYLLDRDLAGRDGERRLVKDALGDPIEMRETVRTQRGHAVRLTLDANIQDQAENVLAEVGQEWQPKGATALVMDPRTGAILALANWPQVNANKLHEAPAYAMTNRATGANYEPGSTFKAITVAGALEDGKVTPDTEFTLPPSIRVADREIGESHERGWTTLTTRAILEQSSNVGAIKIGLELGARRFDHWVRRFGFGKKTGVDLPGEERGILLPLDKYSGSSMGNLPIGQGLAVTPMQMAAAYAAIANGGILRPPHIVASVGGRRTPVPKGRRVISETTAASVRRMLEGVLGPGGTASGAHIDGYVLAGKTGTAEKPDETGGYSDTKFVASFVGFAPARDPKLLVTVMVDEPSGDIYGGTIAAPAFKEITSFALNYLRIAPD